MFLLDILPDELLVILFGYARKDFLKLSYFGRKYFDIFFEISNLIDQGKIDPSDYFYIKRNKFNFLYSKNHTPVVIFRNTEYTKYTPEYASTYNIFYNSKIIRKIYAHRYMSLISGPIHDILVYQILYDQDDIPEFHLYKGHTYYVCERYIKNIYEQEVKNFEYSENWTKLWNTMDNDLRRDILNYNEYLYT
jgi:hypothetical protein